VSDLRLLLADDHALVREGLRRILEEHTGWAVVAEAGTGRDAARLAVERRPDIAIIDIGMPVLNGIEAARRIVRRCPHTSVLILSMFSDEAYVTQAFRVGAKGYILKDSAHSELIGAVTSVAEGKSYFSPKIAKIMQHDYAEKVSERELADRYDLLSDREREIFHLVAEGHPNKEIADILCVAASTVEKHRAHIMEKLDVHTAAEIVLYAVRKGIIK
jgi:two-component system, NarL family, response regulator NreC